MMKPISKFIYLVFFFLKGFIMVLKTGSDRLVWPVGLPVGPTGWTTNRSLFQFGPVIRPDGDRTGIRPLEPAIQSVNRTNRPVLREKTGSNFFIIFYLVFQMLIFNLHIPISKINEDMNFIFISMQKSSWIFKHWHVMFLFWVII